MPEDVAPLPNPAPRFAGFTRPGYTPVPNALFDEVMHGLSGAELKALVYIIRQTLGWQREMHQISLAHIMTGTGLSRRGAILALANLEANGHILVMPQTRNDGGSEASTYALHWRSEAPEGGGAKVAPQGGLESAPPPVQKLHPLQQKKEESSLSKGGDSPPISPPVEPGSDAPITTRQLKAIYKIGAASGLDASATAARVAVLLGRAPESLTRREASRLIDRFRDFGAVASGPRALPSAALGDEEAPQADPLVVEEPATPQPPPDWRDAAVGDHVPRFAFVPFVQTPRPWQQVEPMLGRVFVYDPARREWRRSE